MRNRYPGTCYFCSRFVEKGEGFAEKLHTKYGEKWAVIHADCVLKQRKEKEEYAKLAGRRQTTGSS